MPRASRTAGLLLLLALAAPARAHPVPKDNHDRTVVVRLTADAVHRWGGPSVLRQPEMVAEVVRIEEDALLPAPAERAAPAPAAGRR